MAFNPMSLAGRSILVTGASSGIGRETAIVLSRLDARLTLVARNRQRLEETLSRLHGEGHRLAPFDLAQADEIPAWLKSLCAAGPFHGLAHCAGIQRTLPLRSLNTVRIEDLMRVNFTSAVLLAKALRQTGCAAPGCSLVFLSSIMGLVGQPGIAAYSASKSALMGLTRSLALELARENMRVNCVAPAYVQSEMLDQIRESLSPEQFQALEAQHPLGIGTARDVAYAVAFLLADAARWITGSTLVVDGGYSAH